MGISGISTSSLVALEVAGNKQLLAAAQPKDPNRSNANASISKPTDKPIDNAANNTKDNSAVVQLSETAANTANADTSAAQKKQVSEADAALLAKLQARDRQVRQHEMAHLAVSGGLATSGASYTYQKGPDGVNYAVGGEVSIDTSPGRTPEDTIARARQIQAAALAPADPSGQDRSVAAQAQQMEIQARAELAAAAAPATKSVGISEPTQASRQQVEQTYNASSINAGSSAINTYA